MIFDAPERAAEDVELAVVQALERRMTKGEPEAVVALGDATQRVRDGQRITVDGHTGQLELHD